MASFLSGMLGMGEQELRFHVQRANTWTLAPLLAIFPFLSSDSSMRLCELQCGKEDGLPQGPGRESRLQSVCFGIGVTGWGERLSDKDEEGQDWSLTLAAMAQAKGAADFSQLDRGCLTEIMSHLDSCSLGSCSLVCRDWLEASNFVHTSMTLQEGPQLVALPSLLARFPRLNFLSIKGSPDVDQPDSESLDSPKPAKLPLDGCTVKMITQGCSKLRALQLIDCSISNVELSTILRSCPGLIDLSMSYCDGFSGEGFKGLQCKLEFLELLVCEEVTNKGLLAAAAACVGLNDLAVTTERADTSLAEGLEGFARQCSGLTALAIHSCRATEKTLQCFAAGCPRLQELRMSCERSITDAGLADFFAQLPLMQSVKLHCNHSVLGIPHFGPSRSLKRLGLGLLWDMPDLAFQGLANESNLEELTFLLCPTLTDPTVEKILVKCNKLKRLVLTNNTMITAETVRAYVRSGSTATLEITRCPKVSTEELSEEILQLERLQISS